MEKSLYNIEIERRLTLEHIERLEGELTPELEAELEIQEHELKVKSLGYLEVISSKESFNNAIDDEIKRLQALKKNNDTIISRLKDNLLNAVKTFGEFEAGFNKFGTRKSSSVIVDDVNQLPKEYKNVKVTESADKAAIKKALKNGVDIEGCYIQDNQNLKIN